MPIKSQEYSFLLNHNSCNKTKKQIHFTDLQTSHREIIGNLPVLDAFRDHLSWRGMLDSGYIPQRFLMRKSGKSIDCVESLCLNYYQKNIVISAPAGYGKTTALLMVYLNGGAITNQHYYYIAASAFVGEPAELDEYEYTIRCAIEENQFLEGVVLLDGLEETYGKNYIAAGKLVRQIISGKNHVWVACRPEFYSNLSAQFGGGFADVADIEEWNDNDFQTFLCNYSNNRLYKSAIERIGRIQAQSVIAKTSIPKCPLYATMLLFIAADSSAASTIRDEYDLLNSFLTLWIEREIVIQGSSKSTEYYFLQFQQIAVDLYIHGRVFLDEYPSLSLDDGIIRGLLRVQKNNNNTSVIRSFYHREFLVFFVVSGMLKAAFSSTDDIVYWYSQTFYDDVTNLYKQALSHLDNQLLDQMYKNFFLVYRDSYENTSQIEAALNRFISTIEPLHYLKLRDELLYFIFKLPGVDTDEFLSFADNHCRNTKDYMLMLGLAYGMAGKQQHPLTLKFAKRLENGNPEATVNRGWAVCFFGDINEDGYTYKDQDDCNWDNVRTVKLDRLKRNDNKAYRYRLLDLPLIYCFYESRGFKDCISYSEYVTIKNCDISCIRYTKEERDFLASKKEQLVSQYKQHLIHFAANFHFPVYNTTAKLAYIGGIPMIEISKEIEEELLQQEQLREAVSNNLRDFWDVQGDEIVQKYSKIINAPTGKALAASLLDEKLSHCKVLLLTANSVEGAIITRCLMETSNCTKLDRITEDNHTYQFGTIHDIPVVHIWPQGTSSFTVHGSFRALRAAFKRFTPQCVFSLGVAFGGNTSTQKLGDVLVSERLVFYDSFNKITDGNLLLSPDEVQLVGENILAGCQFLKFDNPPDSSNLSNICWHLGTMLSGGTVLSDPFEKARLFQAASKLGYDIVGGEMEGSGVYFACNNTADPIPFLVVKGICDWAINKNGWSFVSPEKKKQDRIKDCIQAFATENAFKVVSYMLTQISL